MGIPLKDIFAIGCAVYSNEYVGDFSNMKARYEKNSRSFVYVEDKGHIHRL